MNTEDFYTRLEEIYNDSESLMSRKIALVGNIIPSGKSLLDLGCGTGIFIDKVKDKFTSVLGVDADGRSIGLCRERFKNDPRVTIRLCGAENIGSIERTFDTVACLDVIEHLEDPENTLETLHGKMEEGGTLVVTVPNWYNRIVSFVTGDKLHKHFHTSWGWARMIARHGFVIENIRSVAFPLINSEALCKKFHVFGMCILLTARKTND